MPPFQDLGQRVYPRSGGLAILLGDDALTLMLLIDSGYARGSKPSQYVQVHQLILLGSP